MLALVGAGVCVAASLAHFFHTIMAAQDEASIDAPAQREGAQRPDARGVASLGWFGTAPDDAAVAQAGDGGSSTLQLKGISQSDDPLLAGAFIAIRGGTEAYYRRGEALPGNGGILEDVYADHVTLRNGDVFTTLNFGAAAPAEATAKTETTPGTVIAGGEASAFVKEPDVAVAMEAAKKFAENPAAMLKEVGLEPVSPGKDMGYRFTGGDTRHVFDGSGLVKGDVITAVNGIAIGDAANDAVMLPNFVGLRTLSLSVRRGDKENIIEYHMP
jgi:type II secretion system protein C